MMNILLVFAAALLTATSQSEADGYHLVWHDEFDKDGAPGKEWSYESGFVRNEELQWYQKDNAQVKNGYLIIEGRKQTVKNKNYVKGSTDWKTNREYARFTSSCLTTRRSFSFRYGRVEVRAKIPTAAGSWPAIWLLGNQWEWPMNGEIDMLEYYIKNGVPTVMANACWGSERRWTAVWDECATPFSHFTNADKDWADKFHVWQMDWDKKNIRLYLDGELLNEIDLTMTGNKGYKGNYENPFCNTIEGFDDYILLNLAIGGNGGISDDAAFPLQYLIDYVRVYQK